VRIGTEHPRGGVLGLLPELSRDALGLLTRCARDYGDFVRIRLGLTNAVLISHPDLVEEVLVTRHQEFRKNLGTRRLRTALGNGLLLSEDDVWLRQRRLMQPAFHRQRVDALADTMVATASHALDRWPTGQPCDIYQELTAVTLKIVARALFGTDTTRDLPLIRRSSLIMTAHPRSRLFSLMR
jgi:cytochrome P450